MKKELTEQLIATILKLRKHVIAKNQMSKEQRAATFLQFHALRFLNENPKVTVGEFATDLCMSSAAIAQLIERLQSNGWIVRENNDSDRRIIHLSLSDKGKKELSIMRLTFMDKVNSVLKFVSEDDVKELTRILNQILEGLNKND
ncbi:MAG: MarR family transcriptional regulator [Candidatus Dojkabacteria bacterium]|nr:MAG: MarR family transcriptional regulator [Candidatus Dojkabacteria bacterium]